MCYWNKQSKSSTGISRGIVDISTQQLSSNVIGQPVMNTVMWPQTVENRKHKIFVLRHKEVCRLWNNRPSKAFFLYEQNEMQKCRYIQILSSDISVSFILFSFSKVNLFVTICWSLNPARRVRWENVALRSPGRWHNVNYERPMYNIHGRLRVRPDDFTQRCQKTFFRPRKSVHLHARRSK